MTRKNLIVRLQAPRFFLERDLVVLSANVHNYLQSTSGEGGALLSAAERWSRYSEVPADLGLKQPAAGTSLSVDVPKDGERRVDWVVRVVRPDPPR